MREKRWTLILVGILSLSFAFAGLMNGTVFADETAKCPLDTKAHQESTTHQVMNPIFQNCSGKRIEMSHTTMKKPWPSCRSLVWSCGISMGNNEKGS